jgi:D-beta-D-heptose 7-phosphate kinase/D-beta-D-heptose 1-phosphate adenosyltransferase
MIAPDVLVKGGDYKGKQVVGTEFAKELKLVDFVDG